MVVVMMMALFSAFAIADTATAQTGPNVPTGATVSGGAVAPRIECKWELPDMVSSATDPSIQYNNDDAPSTYPSPDPACDLPAGGGTATQADGVTSMIQVRPNAYDSPEERRIENWAAVDHPNGISNISDVYWKIFHPDGSFKLQIHGVKVPVGECETLGSTGTVTTMWGSAVATHQVSASAVNDINRGIVTKCKQQEKAIYHMDWPLSKHQMCGAYKVELHAVSNGTESVLTNYIDVLCTFYGNIDFSTANFGTITPGLTKVLSGDFLFQPPTSTAPTVSNGGNSGLGVSVNFSTMVQQNTPGGKIIDQFDACFGRLRNRVGEDGNYTLYCVDPIFVPGSAVPLYSTLAPNDINNQRLCSDEVGKLDLSIHPPSSLPAGQYAGTVDIIFSPLDGCPTLNGRTPPGA